MNSDLITSISNMWNQESFDFKVKWLNKDDIESVFLYSQDGKVLDFVRVVSGVCTAYNIYPAYKISVKSIFSGPTKKYVVKKLAFKTSGVYYHSTEYFHILDVLKTGRKALNCASFTLNQNDDDFISCIVEWRITK